MTKNELEKKLKAAESALVWYACNCVVGIKKKFTDNGVRQGHPTSLVADRYFKKHGYDEKKVRVIK